MSVLCRRYPNLRLRLVMRIVSCLIIFLPNDRPGCGWIGCWGNAGFRSIARLERHELERQLESRRTDRNSGPIHRYISRAANSGYFAQDCTKSRSTKNEKNA